ncbi:MAG TPA: AraC family transcriptional regulator ligand-binding domain-containing protein [Cyclobacteriaceae bacterium]|nr:AraC family transcriptional regulator ligand-binding domain-containing protein [Cyclobacteriaceae bacterium]
MPIIRDIIYGATAQGAQVDDLCRKLGIESADLNNSDKRPSFETACLSWEYAVKATGDPMLGLHIGESATTSIMGLVGYLMQNSATLLEAFRRLSKYSRVATNMFDYRIVEKKDLVTLEYVPATIWSRLYPNGARHASEQAMAGTLNVFYLLSGRKIRPVRTELRVARRKDLHEYERVFGAVVPGSPVNRLVFQRETLMVPVLSHDRSLLRVFEKLVKEKGSKVGQNTLAGQLRAVVMADFGGQVPPVSVLASKMNMTIRSLQRQLAAEKTCFRRISRQIREEVSNRLLSSTLEKVADVARIVGYSTPRSFRRAYKSWTKRTPAAAKAARKRS